MGDGPPVGDTGTGVGVCVGVMLRTSVRVGVDVRVGVMVGRSVGTTCTAVAPHDAIRTATITMKTSRNFMP